MIPNRLHVGDVVYRVVQGQIQASTILDIRPRSFWVLWDGEDAEIGYDIHGVSRTQDDACARHSVYTDEAEAMRRALAYERQAALRAQLQAQREGIAQKQTTFSQMAIADAARLFAERFSDDMGEYLSNRTSRFSWVEWQKLMED